METIANVVNTATKAIWGEQPNPTTTNETAGSEPVSGMQGKGTVTDPYDQGNAGMGYPLITMASCTIAQS